MGAPSVELVGAELASGPDPTGPGRRVVVLHALAALLVVTAAALVLHTGYPAISDEGSVLAQARLLQDRRFGDALPLPGVAASAEFPPLQNARSADGSYFPYVNHLMLPALVAASTWAFGDVGALLLSAWSVWLAGLAAAALASRLDRRLVVVALWSTMVASPLVFDLGLVVATGSAAAALGFLVLSTLRALDRAPGWRCVPVLTLAFVTPLLRGEGLLAVGALAVVLGVSGIIGLSAARRRGVGGGGVPPGRYLFLAFAIAVAGAAGYLADSLATGWAIGGGVQPFVTAGPGYDPFLGRLKASWVSVLRPDEGGSALWSALAVAVLVGLVGAAVLIRRGRRSRAAPALLGVSAAAAIGLAVGPPHLITGFIVAAPVLVAGLVLLRPGDLRPGSAGPADGCPTGRLTTLRLCLATAALTAVAVSALSYDNGGGAEWGGRYYHLLLPLLVPAGLLGLLRGRDLLPEDRRTEAAVAVAVIAASLSVLGIRTLQDRRAGAEFTVRTVVPAIEQTGPAADGGTPIVVSDRPTLGRFAWSELHRFRLLSVTDTDRLNEVADQLRRAGVTRWVLVTDRRVGTGRLDGTWRVTRIRRSDSWELVELVAR